MSQFLYFLPCQTSVTLDTLKKSGLGYAFDAGNPDARRIISDGPGGSGGYVVSSESPKYVPGEQTWRRIKGDAGAWCGVWDDNKPGPDDLKRDVQIEGSVLTLNDGRQWNCPAARRFEEFDDEILYAPNLPRLYDVDDNGAMIHGDVHPRFQRFWEVALICSEGEGTVELEQEFVGLAWSCNYRAAFTEMVLLRNADEETTIRVLRTVYDMDRYEQFIKKKDGVTTLKKRESLTSERANGSGSTNGPGRSTPAEKAATSRLLPT